jgi:Spy/CpxP family protein refolding chaperone
MVNSIRLALAFLILFAFCDFCSAQQKVEDHFKLRQLITLSGNSDLIKEIELVAEQKSNIKKLVGEYSQKCRRITSEYMVKEADITASDLPKVRVDSKIEEAEAVRVESMEKAAKALLVEADKVLLPHQQSRILQLAFQKQLEFEYKGDKIGMFVGVAEKLQLSKKERDEFKVGVEKAKKEYLAEA